jgi:hypothetical protein
MRYDNTTVSARCWYQFVLCVQQHMGDAVCVAIPELHTMGNSTANL